MPQRGAAVIALRYFPLFLDLRDRLVVIVGGGLIAERKAELLLGTGARILLIAPSLTQRLASRVTAGLVAHLPEPFASGHLSGARLVVAATSDASVNRAVAEAAGQRGLLVNVVDDAALSTCIVPAIIDRSPLVVAVGTAGTAPALARFVREFLESAIDESFGRLAALLARFRGAIRQREPGQLGRRRLYERLLRGNVAGLVRAGRDEAAEAALRLELDARSSVTGRVILVGAGPGDPGLLTLHALRALQSADVVLHDRLVPREILALARRDAQLTDVGKGGSGPSMPQARIHELLVDLAQRGLTVVRLKGGDPFIFGRGGEELEHLRASGVAYEVVPGLTAAVACAAYAGIPLTHRDHSASVRLVSAHCRESIDAIDWQALADNRETLAVYMGVAMTDLLQRELLTRGRPADTPVAFVENGTRAEQRVLHGTLGEAVALARAHRLRSPALLIIGSVARLAATLHWFAGPPLSAPQEQRSAAQPGDAELAA